MMNYLYVAVALFAIIYTVGRITDVIKSFKYKYKDMLSLFEYFLGLTYESIYESDLIVYMSEGVKAIPKEQQETLERNFIKQCVMFMGPNNHRLFMEFYGNEQTMIVNMLRYMRRRINEDGLSKIIKQEQSNI